ncbi:hypothetical protein C1929_04505 [Stenotrophomonas sp. ZAC14D1_NAIMI4_6]|nr:hypothetical protein C1929_04505 [Stenotrophomonas sp. ZAC14D1_NAIMI4_6]AWH40252.1 hypothetical protein C1927_04845 [Stenotrophomonas sp. ZAC14D1_NAIMI4_1]
MPGARTPLQLAFLTGQSDPARCALSPQQRAFGQALLAPGRVLHPCNFPYDAATPDHQPAALLAASWHNTRHYLRSRRPGFAATHGPALAQLLQAAPHTLLLAGSCGLELLANLELPPALAQRCSVLAYGPVARRAPQVAQLQVLVGRQDWVSRLGWRGARQWIDSGHMDYLQQPAVLAIARELAARLQQEQA